LLWEGRGEKPDLLSQEYRNAETGTRRVELTEAVLGGGLKEEMADQVGGSLRLRRRVEAWCRLVNVAWKKIAVSACICQCLREGERKRREKFSRGFVCDGSGPNPQIRRVVKEISPVLDLAGLGFGKARLLGVQKAFIFSCKAWKDTTGVLRCEIGLCSSFRNL
jgi:hypothetical protein